MRMSLIDRLFHRQRPPEVPPGIAVAPVEDEVSAAVASVAAGWTVARLEQAEALWGEGVVWPGGADEFKRLAAPFGLSPAHSLIVLGDGSGGAARVLAADLGAWVSAYESDRVLIGAAEGWRKRSGAALAKRAMVATWTRRSTHFPVKGFHHALLLDALDPDCVDIVIPGLVQAVKPGGQVVLVQTVADANEEGAIVAAMEQAGCDVRVVEDETARQSGIVLHAWKQLVRRLRDARPSPVEAAALVQEAAIWLHRLRRMREGRLRVIRWGAIVG